MEKTARHDVAPYRGQILPLIHLAHVLRDDQIQPATESKLLQVVVYGVEGCQVGLIVDRILDITELPQTDTTNAPHGFGDTVVIQQRVTAMLDLNTLRIAETVTRDQPVHPSRRLSTCGSRASFPARAECAQSNE